MDKETKEYIFNRLSKIQKEFTQIEQIREKAIKLNRELILTTNKVISSLYSKKLDEAANHLNHLIKTSKQAIELISPKGSRSTDNIYYIKILKEGLKEYVETILFYKYLEAPDATELRKLLDKIPGDIFIEGVFDFFGELRRLFLEALKEKNVKEAEKILKFMKLIHDYLLSSGIKSFYVKDFKYKLDGVRQMILRSMEDYIIAIYSSRGEKIE